MLKKKILIIFLLVFLILPQISLALTAEEIKAQIQALLAQIAKLREQLAYLEKEKEWCHNFLVNLKYGDKGKEVKALHIALEKEGFEIKKEEKIKNFFGVYTASAVSGFQQKYWSEVLKPWGLKYGTGYVGPTTRAKLNNLYGCGIEPINKPPVIHSVNGPTTLKVNETGRWTIKASDPEKGPLTYSVRWGDEPFRVVEEEEVIEALRYIQRVTFTHSYSKPGVYYPTFKVTDNKGASAKTRISVKVEEITPVIVSEEVKCIFKNSTSEQRCYTAADSPSPYYGISCSGRETCVVDIKGKKGDKITWKSSCGGYAYTIMDGQNEYAEFNCAPIVEPSITLISPNGGEVWEIGKTYEIKWSRANLPLGEYIGRIDLYKGNSFYGNIQTWNLIEEGTLQNISESALWKVGDIKGGVEEGSDYKIYINLKSIDGTREISDFSDNYFSIVETTQPSITVLSPNGREEWVLGSPFTITWQSRGINKLAIYLWFLDGGTCLIADNVSADLGQYTLTLKEGQQCPNIPKTISSGTYKINIWSIDDPTLEIGTPHDASDDYFILKEAAQITCQDSDGGKNYYEKGYVVVSNLPDVKYLDSCTYEADKEKWYLYETYCGENGKVETEAYPCPQSCSDGACLKTTEPSITLISPNGGETWELGNSYEIRWAQANIDKVTIYLMRTSSLTEDIIASNYQVSFDSPSGSYSYTLPSHLTEANTYKIWIIGYYTGVGQAQDWSDETFTITKQIGLGQLPRDYLLTQTASLIETAQGIVKHLREFLKEFLRR